MTKNKPHFAYIWDDFYFTIFPEGTYDFQQRSGMTLLVSLNNEPFCLHDQNGTKKKLTSALLKRSTPRTLDTEKAYCLAINYFPLSFEYHSIAKFLNGRTLVAVHLDEAMLQADWINDALNERLDSAKFTRGCTSLLNAIDGYSPVRIKMDMRAIYIAQKIRKELPEISALDVYAREVGVSADRLSHLFKEELDIPIKSYILMEKVRRGGIYLMKGMSMAEASLEAGFADSAHFARSFKDFFAVTPGMMTGSVKVHFL